MIYDAEQHFVEDMSLFLRQLGPEINDFILEVRVRAGGDQFGVGPNDHSLPGQIQGLGQVDAVTQVRPL